MSADFLPPAASLPIPRLSDTRDYKCLTSAFGGCKQLFEFIVPLYPAARLYVDAMREYEIKILERSKPTALALSVLDVKHPGIWDDETEVTEHWCLTHYLLDGHHKIRAASNVGKPITMLSFLAVKQSLATEENIAELLDIL